MKKKLKELVELTTGILILMLVFTLLKIGCPIKWLTGISCGGCGMTRALHSAALLRFKEAFYFHPLFWAVPLCIALFVFWDRLSEKTKSILTLMFIFCFTAVYIIRLFNPNDLIVTADFHSSVIFRLITE